MVYNLYTIPKISLNFKSVLTHVNRLSQSGRVPSLLKASAGGVFSSGSLITTLAGTRIGP